jgi:hypothetical protein
MARSLILAASPAAEMPAFDAEVRRSWTPARHLAFNFAFDVDAAIVTRCSAHGALSRRPLSGGTTRWTL